MVPASIEVPAAAVLLAGGLLACFAGYRLFRIVLGIYGFILGALVASSVTGTADAGATLLSMLVGGVIGAVILILAYFVGVALVGAGLGALVVHMISAQLGREPNAIVLIVVAVLGAFGAMVLQRYVIIAGTALGGAWTAIIAGSRFMTGRAVGTEPGAWLIYPTNPAPGQSWVVLAWIVIAIAGTAVQFGVTAGKKKR